MLTSTIKHFSLDAWNTVLIPNPVYAKNRSQMLAEMYGVPVDVAKATYTRMKKLFDGTAEASGAGFPVAHVCAALNEAFGHDESDSIVEQLRGNMEKLFSEYPPDVPSELVTELQRTVGRGCTIGVLSNTNFIAGRVLREVVFDRLGVSFATMLFSDEHGMSKPNPAFFAKMVDEATAQNGHVHSSADIMHIGDMPSTDGQAPSPIRTFIVQDPYHLAHFLKEENNNA